MTDPVVQQPVTQGGYCDDSCPAHPHPFYSFLVWTEYYILDMY